jgi:hypothetical protein
VKQRRRARGGADDCDDDGMAERARGGSTPPAHGAHHLVIVLGLKPKKEKKKAGGQVEGQGARYHLGRRARGGETNKGGMTKDARESANSPDGRDKVTDDFDGNDSNLMGDARARGGGSHAFRTASGRVSEAARRETESKGEAMPGGRFPIRNAGDLSNAKHDYGRANGKPAVKRWINKRAKELGESPMGG